MIRTVNKVALYARFSSDNQRSESIDAQIRAMEAYCKQHHYLIVDTYIDEANDSYIKKAAEEASVVILAYGKAVDTNISLYNRAKEVISLLSDQKDKFRVISDGKRIGLHPLTPSVRSAFTLVGASDWLEASKKVEDKSNNSPKKAKNSQKSKAIDF